jgi:hypothetical protein
MIDLDARRAALSVSRRLGDGTKGVLATYLLSWGGRTCLNQIARPIRHL